ncbi:MAG: hypothetical protein ABW128_00565 [Rhizorhabdus sp.]
MFVACKLPHGLTIKHNGQTINLNGANEGYDAADLARNGVPRDGENRSGGFGLTELTGDQAAAFDDWVNRVTYTNGKKDDGKLAEPFGALENGSILTFKSESEARKETKAMADAITTGTEGIDPATDKQMKAAGLETADKK